MPVNMDYVHPIIQAFLEASRLGQERRRAEETGKLESEAQKEKKRQFDEEQKRLKEASKQALDIANARQKLTEAQLKATHARNVFAAKNEALQTMGQFGIPPEGAEPSPLNLGTPERESDFIRKLQLGNFGRAYEFKAPIDPGIPELNIPPTSITVPTAETIGANRAAMLAPVEAIKQGTAEEAFRRQLELAGINIASKEKIAKEANETRLSVADKLAAARRAAGATARTGARQDTRVDNWIKTHDSNPLTRRFVIAKEGLDFVNSLPANSNNPADDQGLIYAFAKAMDPDSVVREGEYGTVQKYSQSWAEKFKFSAQRVLNNQEFLTPEARNFMKDTIRSKVTATERVYQDYRKTIADRVDSITGEKTGEELLGGFLSPIGKKKLTQAEALQRGLVWDDSVKAYRKVGK